MTCGLRQDDPLVHTRQAHKPAATRQSPIQIRLRSCKCFLSLQPPIARPREGPHASAHSRAGAPSHIRMRCSTTQTPYTLPQNDHAPSCATAGNTDMVAHRGMHTLIIFDVNSLETLKRTEKMLSVLTIALLFLSGGGNARQQPDSLSFDLCASFNSESFFCSTLLGHFCTYCTKRDAPSDASDKHTCVTKKGVKRAIAGKFPLMSQRLR